MDDKNSQGSTNINPPASPPIKSPVPPAPPSSTALSDQDKTKESSLEELLSKLGSGTPTPNIPQSPKPSPSYPSPSTNTPPPLNISTPTPLPPLSPRPVVPQPTPPPLSIPRSPITVQTPPLASTYKAPVPQNQPQSTIPQTTPKLSNTPIGTSPLPKSAPGPDQTRMIDPKVSGETSPQSSDLSFRSSIRTMQDDLSALKKGQTPSGVELETQKASAPPSPRIPLRVELGTGQKSGTLPMVKTSPPIATPSTPPPLTVNPPKTSPGINKRVIIYIALVILILASGAVWFFLIKGNEVAIPSPTATPTQETTPTPPVVNILESLFGGNLGSITIPNSGEPYGTLNNFIAGQQVSIGGSKFYKISDQNGNRYGFPAFLNRLIISKPDAISTLDGKNEFIFGIYENIDKKNIGLIVPVINANDTSITMRGWEQSIAVSFANLFKLNQQKRSSSTFLDNVYRGVAIRYINFPGPDLTIDYALINLTPELNLLIITNSRDQIYSIIDKLQGF